MSHGHFFRAIMEFGIIGTWKKIHKMRTLKFGNLIGVDRYGNSYYENTVDYPHGQHRWVEYAGDKTFYEVDASNVPPEWHGWLHGVTEAAPTSRTTGSVHKVAPIANSYGSSNPYKRNLGGVITAHSPNLSTFRPRGYGLGNGLTDGSKPNEELYYTQPGWPLDKRNATRRAPRKDRVNFTLADTTLTLKAKQAVRAGLSLEDYDKITDSDSMTRITMLAANTPATCSDEPVMGSEHADALMQQTLEGELPSDPVIRERAVRVASSTGHARSWGKELENGTFAAAVSEVLTPEEEEFWAAGFDEDELLNEISRYQNYVDTYSTVPNKLASSGVVVATEKRDEAVAKLQTLRNIKEKLNKLSQKYDEMAVQAAAQATAAARNLA